MFQYYFHLFLAFLYYIHSLSLCEEKYYSQDIPAHTEITPDEVLM